MLIRGLHVHLRGRRRAVPLLAAAAFGLVALGTASALWHEHETTLEAARTEAATISALVEESTARTFDSVDIALAGLAQRFGAGPLPRHDAASRQAMQDLLARLPTVRAIYVIGPDGFIQHDTDYPKTPDVSLADRTYFRAFVAQPGLQRHLSEALQSRSGQGAFIAYSHRITRTDGSFGGIVVAAVQLKEVAAGYGRLGFRDRLQLTLLERDGHVLARHPDDGHTGRSYAAYPVFAHWLPGSAAGVFDTDGPPYADRPRIVSYRALDSQPLVVVVAIDHGTALAGWTRTMHGAVLGLSILGALTLAGIAGWWQRQREQDRAHAHRRRADEASAHAARLQLLATELTDADQRKTQFLATLSHELRNALAPVQNCLLVLQRVDAGSDSARRAWQILRNQVEQLRRLLDDLMDVGRINSGRLALDLERLDLRDVVLAACAASQAAVDAAGHRVSSLVPARPVGVRADRVRLLQVLANLLNNAVKYTPAGTGVFSVSLSASAERAVIEVRDNGLGISPEDQARVFDMFVQVEQHAAHAAGGLGIGLALVARLVALHGGEVAVTSAGEGTGSTFTVSLPLDAATPPGPVEPSAHAGGMPRTAA